ncbi:type II restriction endonuclease [Kiloniella sp. EL199]|uniref:type II restriction endonuclease n=1 Tax=Kiloniella sp. EL199 TaxID=2107581 RepID=UPI000EA0250B|nr:type II restriction endonuclease [Kiloniella sp. EL199]
MRVLGNIERKGNNRFVAKYIWLLDEQETITEDGFLSWYDTRANQSHRSAEWRLYYQTNAVTELMNEGDRLFIARQRDETILFIVTPAHNSIESGLLWLFGLNLQSKLPFGAQEITKADDTKLDFTARFILDEIGVEFEDPNANTLDSIIERFENQFPSTKAFSDLARLTLPELDARDDPDIALLTWLDHEEAMFRRLEKKIVSNDISKGWMKGGEADVDSFIKYSLSVQNRRKSRMGHSFQNHLGAVFDAFEVRYDPQIITENGKKPDFIFPGKTEYEDVFFDTGLLTMLAAKSSCKDRWSQILPEAKKIKQKHLVTLEPAISEAQTAIMKQTDVQLIVPGQIRKSYTASQQEWIWSINDFVKLILERQK